jgi:hypothetical protein
MSLTPEEKTNALRNCGAAMVLLSVPFFWGGGQLVAGSVCILGALMFVWSFLR